MKRNWLIFLAVTTLVLLLFLIDLLSGSAAISLSDVLKALSGGDVPDSVGTVVLNIRLLKALAALLAGAALSVSGLQMQTLFRNPLAGPYVLGVSSGASLGVALFILGIPFLSPSIGQVVIFGNGRSRVGRCSFGPRPCCLSRTPHQRYHGHPYFGNDALMRGGCLCPGPSVCQQ